MNQRKFVSAITYPLKPALQYWWSYTSNLQFVACYIVNSLLIVVVCIMVVKIALCSVRSYEFMIFSTLSDLPSQLGCNFGGSHWIAVEDWDSGAVQCFLWVCLDVFLVRFVTQFLTQNCFSPKNPNYLSPKPNFAIPSPSKYSFGPFFT